MRCASSPEWLPAPEFDTEDARLIRSILMFDPDRDGAVTLDEIIAAVEALTGQA